MTTAHASRLAAVALILTAVATAAHGHGGHADDVPDASLVDEGDMVIGATAGGRLALAFDFSTPVRAAFAGRLGPLATYSATDPGFDELRADARLRTVRAGTRVWLELLGNDGGRTAIKLRDTLLVRPGERALLGVSGTGSLHYHPEFHLVLDREAGEFGEGALTFRLVTDAAGYRSSEPYTLRVSNGFLGAPRYSSARYDTASLACQRAVSRQVWRFASALAAATEACARDGEVCAGPGGPRVDPAVARSRVHAAREAAQSAILAACGPDGSGDHDGMAVQGLLGLVAGRLAAVTAAAHARGGETCGEAIAAAAWEVMRSRGVALRPCLIAAAAGAARREAGLTVPAALIEARCAHARGRGSNAATPIGRIERARRRAARSVRRACGVAESATALLRDAACAADEIVSAAHLSAKSVLSGYVTRPSQGGRRVAEHFPCLRGGHAHGGRP